MEDEPIDVDEIDCADACIVCFEAAGVPLRPCLHRVCIECTTSWMSKGHATCPMCRGVILGFDTHAAPEEGGGQGGQGEEEGEGRPLLAPPRPSRARMHITIDLPADTHVGVTVCDHPRGVRVQKLVKADRAAVCGLRYGDVITRLNELPVPTHAFAVQIFNDAAQRGESILCEVIRHPHRVQRWWDALSAP